MDESALLHELEPTVERLFARHLDATKEWFPHEHIPYSRGRDATPDVPWGPDDADLAGVRIDDAVRSALVVNLLTEDNLPYYFRTIERVFGADGVWGAWARRWTAEEGRHSMAIYGYLMVTRAVDPRALERARMAQVSGGLVPEPGLGRRRVRVRRPAGVGHTHRPPQHRTPRRRSRRLRRDDARRRRREPALPLLPRPRRGGDRARPERVGPGDRASGHRLRDARWRHPRLRRPRRGDRQGWRVRPRHPPRADPRAGDPAPLEGRPVERARRRGRAVTRTADGAAGEERRVARRIAERRAELVTTDPRTASP